MAYHAATTDNVAHGACIVDSVDGPVLPGDEDTLWTTAIGLSLDHCSWQF